MTFMRFYLIFLTYVTAMTSWAGIDFAKDVQPIFAAHCIKCHGPDNPKADLDLSTRKGILAILDSGKAAVAPGNPDASPLMARVTSLDPDELMPPPKKGERLAAAQIATLRRWIKEGAEWSTHWAYRPLEKPATPSVKDKIWPRNPIDNFVLTKLERNDITPSPEAERHTLIRRLSYDLLGLPPTPSEVRNFESDKSPEAYSKLVDRLLTSPHFGERWGRHWLDKARYADSDGYEKDRPRMNAWRYRDWVINSINADLPFDQFTIQQLAGDLLPNATDLQKLATAFNRQTLTNTEGGTDKEQWRVAAVMDRVETLGSVWLGLTVTCARCHNHKYDQLTHKEYYQLFAYFNNGDETSASVPRSRQKLSAFAETQAAHDTKMKAFQAQVNARDEVLRQSLPKLEKALRSELAKQASSPAAYHPIKLLSARAGKNNSVKFSAQEDGSLLVSGDNPDGAEYELELETQQREITGLKLEVLPDSSLPAKGPGRTPHGNFVLNDIRVYASTRQEFTGQPLKLSRATASHSQKDWPAGNAIDGRIGVGSKGTGWAIGPAYGKPHTLTVTFTQPLRMKSNIFLHVVLDQKYGKQHTIGRFRISTRTGHAPGEGIPKNIAQLLVKNPSQRAAAEQQALFSFVRDRDPETTALQAQIKNLNASAPKPPVMSVRVLSQRTNSPRATHIFHRGEFKQPKDKVSPLTPATLPTAKNRAQGDRLDLARWLVDGQNPIVPRVTANHIWMHLFGEGLVRTVNDFGVRGDAPTHPQLLDWLAGEFIRQKWSRKDMIRLIVHSATYRQSSVHRPELTDRDPNNHLLHRQNRFRVEAEIIRDLSLATSGLLSPKIGGPSVFPPLPAGVADLSYANNFKWNPSKGEDRYRRGMYTFFKRTSPHPNLLTFDCPDSNVTCVKRTRSNTPLAALATLNNEVFTEAAKALGKRMLAASKTDTERLTAGFQICVARKPDIREMAALTNLLHRARVYYKGNEATAKTFNGDAEASAWAIIARVLQNLDEFITRE